MADVVVEEGGVQMVERDRRGLIAGQVLPGMGAVVVDWVE